MKIVSLILMFFTLTTTAQDWANLGKYQKENAAVQLYGNQEGRVVFMGNSITEGWSTALPEFF